MTYYAVNQSEDFNYKSKLLENPKKYDIHNFDTKVSGRFDIEFPEVNFECFAKPSEYKNLFVFFSAAGRSSGKTIFNRISWCNKLNGFCLYIEDPMYKKHPGLSAGWYFGTNNISYLEYAIEIVKKVAQKQNISNENIFFVGSSSGGYAALFCANKIDYSNAYAYNPQIYLNRAPEYPNFNKITQIDLSTDSDIYLRHNIDYIAENNKSNFFIFYNQVGPFDKIHFESWLEKLQIKSEPQLKIYNNTHFLIQNIQNSNPHSCVAEIEDFIHCLTALKLKNDDRYDLLNSSLNRLKNYSNIVEDNFYLNLWMIFSLNKLQDYIDISKSFKNNNHYMDFKVLTYPKLLVYRISYNRLKNRGESTLYIRRNFIHITDYNYEKLTNLCKKLNLKITNHDKHFKIIKKFTGTKDIHKNMLDFIDLTYEKVEKTLMEK